MGAQLYFLTLPVSGVFGVSSNKHSNQHQHRRNKLPVPFVWLHIVALGVLISPLGRKAGPWVNSLKPARLTAGLTILVFIGTMMQHLMGNILFETVLAQPLGYIEPAAFSGIWTGIFLVYPFERLGLILLAVVIGAPLIRVLKKSLFRDT